MLVKPLPALPVTCVQVAQMAPVLSWAMVIDSLLLFMIVVGKPLSRVNSPPE